eukprot:gene119-2351_t
MTSRGPSGEKENPQVGDGGELFGATFESPAGNVDLNLSPLKQKEAEYTQSVWAIICAGLGSTYEVCWVSSNDEGYTFTLKASCNDLTLCTFSSAALPLGAPGNTWVERLTICGIHVAPVSEKSLLPPHLNASLHRMNVPPASVLLSGLQILHEIISLALWISDQPTHLRYQTHWLCTNPGRAFVLAIFAVLFGDRSMKCSLHSFCFGDPGPSQKIFFTTSAVIFGLLSCVVIVMEIAAQCLRPKTGARIVDPKTGYAQY